MIRASLKAWLEDTEWVTEPYQPPDPSFRQWQPETSDGALVVNSADLIRAS